MSAQVVQAPNLFDYFRELIETARADTHVQVGDEASLYLASMLAERARTERTNPDLTLVELHMRASQGSPAERASSYRELGDQALHELGYFTDSVRSRVVSENYYAEMGAAGYDNAAAILRQWFADALGPILRELSQSFVDCVELLGRVREANRPRRDEVDGLYAEWLESRDEQIAGRLRKLGLIIPRGGLVEG